MNLNYKKLILDAETEKIKDELKNAGSKLQEKASEPQGRLLSELSDMYDRTEENKARKVKTYLFKPYVWAPVLAVVIIAIVGFNMMNQPPVYMKYPDPIYYNLGGMESATGSSSMDVGIGSSSTSFAQPQATFKQRFIENLGQHAASPEDIAKAGSMLEKDVNVNIMLVKKVDSVELFAKTIFEPLGGYVQNIGQNNYYGDDNSFWVRGRIPADKMDLFRMSLKNFVGKDKYYQENLSAQSRTADIVVIDQNIKSVQDTINYLKAGIAKETDEVKKSALQKQLNQNNAYLKEREQTKKEILAQVNYVDVSLNAQTIPNFWSAKNINDIQNYFYGYESVSLWSQMLINALFVCIGALKILSWTFWAIIIVVWLIIRKRRKNKWLEQME
ncbi:MAG: DUF4349 domain-containing protein [Parcubacteria group bacterium]